MRSVLLRIVVSLAVTGTAAPVYAQTPRPDRPYRGLFGGGTAGTTQLLALNVDFGGGYDTNVLASENVNLPNTPAETPSEFVSGSGDLSYSIATERVSFSANGGAGAFYYPSLENPWVERYFIGAGGSWRITTKTSLSVNQSARFDPLYSLAPTGIPGGGAPAPPGIPDPGAALQLEEHWTYGTSASLSHQFTLRFGVYATANRSRSQSHSEDFNVTSRSLGGGGTFRLTKNLGVHLGYNFSETEFEDDSEPTDHSSLDGGIDYGRSISLSRRTTLGFGGGLASVVDGGDTSYTLVGHVDLNHEIGRTWSANGVVSRNVAFSDLLQDTVLSDNFGASLRGLFSRRLSANVSTNVVRGELTGEDKTSNTYYTTQANADLTFAVSRNVGLALEYTYYTYHFAESFQVPAGLPSETRRNSVQVVAKFWAPFYQRPRSANASR